MRRNESKGRVRSGDESREMTITNHATEGLVVVVVDGDNSLNQSIFSLL